MNLVSLCRLFADGRDSDSPVTRSAGTIIDFARLRADVAFNALRLRQHGCRRGLLHTRDCYWGAVGLFALMHAGAEVVIPQNAQAGSLAAISGAWDLMICDESANRVDAALVLESAASSESNELAPLDPATPLTFFTSGSTGVPKRVAKTLAHLDRELECVAPMLQATVPSGACVQATVTHQHVYGMTFRLCWPLASGRPFGRLACEFWETALAELTSGAVLITSPAHLERLGGIAPITLGDRPSLVLSAGAPLSEDAIGTAAAVFGVPVTEIFGSTETGAIAWRRHEASAPAWQALPGVAIVGTSDGLLRVSAPHVPGGEHITSDRADVYQDGRFRFRGRNDAILKIEGRRISLSELEEQLRALTWIADAAVVPLSGQVAQLAAAVVPTAAGAAMLTEVGAFRFGRRLRRALSERYEADALPRRWRFVTNLPTGPLGKRSTDAVARLFEDNRLIAGTARPHDPEIRAVRREADGADFDLFIPSDIAYVDGHFPDAPIVPGVALVHWAVKFAAQHLDFPLETAQAFQVKFRRLILPGIAITLSLRRGRKSETLLFQYTLAKQILSSGSILMGDV